MFPFSGKRKRSPLLPPPTFFLPSISKRQLRLHALGAVLRMRRSILKGEFGDQIDRDRLQPMPCDCNSDRRGGSPPSTMKASLKFQEDGKPLVRAKAPISILGLPFLSGFAAALDDVRHLRFDLSTAFASGPSLRFSCRPNHPAGPFSLVLKTGLGPLGSPNMGAPFSMAAEFGFLARPGVPASPYLTILLKPRLGDFTIKETVSSAIAAAATSSKSAPTGNTIAGISSENKLNDDKRPNELPVDGIGSGINGLASGFEVSTCSILPIRRHTAVKFKWGLRVPPELRVGIDYPPASIPLSKIPLLVMSKISIYQGTNGRSDSTSQKKEATEAVSVMRQLESLQAENGMLKKAVEELQTEASRWKMAPPAATRLDGGRGGAKVPATVAKRGSRGNEEVAEKTGQVEDADVREALKKALSTGART